MASASSSIGMVGKWGSTKYVPITNKTSNGGKSKFFSSRNTAGPVTPMKPVSKPVESNNNNIKVCVRLRPPLKNEGIQQEEFLNCNENTGDIFVSAEKCFKFDQLYGCTSDQTSFYAKSVSEPVSNLVRDGTHASVFAYGQTGTGKTYTMGTDWKNGDEMDNNERKGVIPRAIEQIFDEIKILETEQLAELSNCEDDTQHSDFSVRMSFFEIHNEKIFDLLKAAKMKVPLKLKEEGHEFAIPDLTSHSVASETEAIALLEQGCQTRSTGATAQNAHSSRSHAVLRLSVVRDGIQESRISLVDLAGSESAAKSENEQTRLEGVNINKGLSVLGRCISAICDGDKHIPFRDSILTKVLRDSLTGRHARTVMIACISPSEEDLRETMNTLRYADCVKRMTKPAVPEHLANLVKSSTKKRLQAMIPPTPANHNRKRLNATIATPTPTKKPRARPYEMNATIGTPFRTPKSLNFPANSSTVSKAPSLDTISDLDTSGFSGISSISNFPPQNLNETAKNVLSPLMRELREDFKKQMSEIAESMKSTLEASILASTRKQKSRMTSSPRRSPRILARSNENSLNSSGEETICSGPALAMGRQKMRNNIAMTPDNLGTLPRALGDVTNKRNHHLRKIEATASPDLRMKDQPRTPPISVMEETLGLNPDSPFMFGFEDSNPRPAAKKSVRRTTMLQPELSKSIRQSMQLRPRKEVRRSVRISSLKDKENDGSPVFKHPLQEKRAWQVKNQSTHNSNILTILNSANMGMLQKMPAIGPKTAIIIHSQRELRDGFKSLEDLKEIPGLQKNFFEKFCNKNQVQFA